VVCVSGLPVVAQADKTKVSGASAINNFFTDLFLVYSYMKRVAIVPKFT
jgi:hypothetical protein